LVHDPDVLILDEPTDGLDPNQKHEVRNLIKGMASEKCIVISTHILEEVEAICNRIIIISEGRILVDETAESLMAKHGGTLNQTFRDLTGPKAARKGGAV
jgi:ABC-2 type transport system ATP-binding protein